MSATQGRTKSKISYLRWIVTLGIAIYAVISIFSQQATLKTQKEHRAELMERKSELETQISILKNEEDMMQTDAYVERAAREKFGWVKEGEILFKKSTKTKEA